MEKLKSLLIVLVILSAFLTGFLSSQLIKNVYIDKESPFLIGIGSNNEQPGNWVKEDNIQIYDDKIVINVKNAMVSGYAPSGSMLPTLGENSNGIEIVPENPEQIQIGDIITYEEDSQLIVHRVIEKGHDSKGYWFVTKGDNNQETDGKVYWENIKYVTIALVY